MLTDTPDGRHLDVGSGTGDLAARAAARGRAVVAVDADPAMAVLSDRVVRGRVPCAGLPSLPFEGGSFDAVTANFVVNHLSDPRAGVRELARVVRPGGSVAVTIWPAGPPAWALLVASAFADAGVDPPTAAHLPGELDFDRSVAGLRALVEAAGLAPRLAMTLAWDWEVHTEDLWAGVTGGVATAGRAYRSCPQPVRFRIDEAFREQAADVTPDGILRLPSEAAYVVAG